MTPSPDPAGSLLSLPPPQLSKTALLRLVRDHWGLAGTLTPLTSERDQNHRLDTATESYTLKLSNPAEPPDLTDFQTRALLHVAARDPGLPTPRVIAALDGRAIISTPHGALRLLTWCPGTPVAGLPRAPALARATGEALARLTQALTDLSHLADSHILLWDIRQFSRLQPLTPALPPDLQAEAARFATRFDTIIAPALARLPTQVVHADFNPHNLLSDPADPDRISGILDFGDMIRTQRICDLAVAASYLIDPGDPFSLLVPLVHAYHTRLPLLVDEIALLPDLITARLLTTLTIANWRAARYPSNAGYILRNAPSAAAGLRAFRDILPDALAETLATSLRTPCERPTP